MSDIDELSITAVVSRSSGGPLALEDPANGYEIVDAGPGERRWRRDVVEGRYVHGRSLLNAVLEARSLTMVVRVSGATWPQVRTRAQTMFDALSQFAYTITITIDGVTDTYVCEPGDIAIAGSDTWDKFRIMDRQQEYVLSIPYDPVKVIL